VGGHRRRHGRLAAGAGMNWREEPLAFACGGDTLVGVLCHPVQATRRHGVLIVVGGPQYRAGSHRMFVELARRLAAAGYPVLRFDVRGMGDSSGAQRSFEALSDDVGAAVGTLLSRVPGLDGVVLWGLCDGASAGLLYLDAGADPRVRGLCLANPWVRSPVSEARTQIKHYYRDRLLSRDFWAKLLRGRVARSALRGLGQSARAALAAGSAGASAFQQRMLRGWGRTRPPTLLLLSALDYTAREFEEYVSAQPDWSSFMTAPQVQRTDIADADHTFSGALSMEAMIAATVGWLDRCMEAR